MVQDIRVECVTSVRIGGRQAKVISSRGAAFGVVAAYHVVVSSVKQFEVQTMADQFMYSM